MNRHNKGYNEKDNPLNNIQLKKSRFQGSIQCSNCRSSMVKVVKSEPNQKAWNYGLKLIYKGQVLHTYSAIPDNRIGIFSNIFI